MFKTSVASNKKNILITGASGFLGELFFNDLNKNPSYNVYGIDKQHDNSPRYQLEGITETKVPALPNDKFFIIDITDCDQLTTFLQDKKIDIIIHLAGVLENQAVDVIKNTNEVGTLNIYQACLRAEIKHVIFASTIMLVLGYFSKEPYRSIKQSNFTGDIAEIPLVTVDDELMIATDTLSYQAYCKSKLYGEEIAKEYFDNYQISSICARFCWVNIKNQPTRELSSIWCSQRDACSFIQKAIEANILFAKYFVCSNNKYRWIDISNAERELNFLPQDKAEDYFNIKADGLNSNQLNINASHFQAPTIEETYSKQNDNVKKNY